MVHHIGNAVELALFPVFQTHHQSAVVGASATVHDGEARHGTKQFDIVYGADVVLHFGDSRLGLVKIRSGSGLHIDEEEALVFLGDEFRLGGLHKPYHTQTEHRQNDPSKNGALDELAHTFYILVQQGVVGRIVGFLDVIVDTLPLFLAFVFRLEHQRAKGRADGQGGKGGDAHRTRHDETELLEEGALRTANEGHGDEHGHKHQCG